MHKIFHCRKAGQLDLHLDGGEFQSYIGDVIWSDGACRRLNKLGVELAIVALFGREISGALARTCGASLANGEALEVELAQGVDLARTCEAS